MSRLPHDASEAVLRLGRVSECQRGTELLRQGEAGTHVYLLRSVQPDVPACAKVTATPENGIGTLLAIRVSGDIVGELGVLREATRGATVKTCTAALTHRISRSEFLDFLDRYPEVWKTLTATLADRLDWANRRRTDFAGYDVVTRLARAILDVAERHGYDTDEGRCLDIQLSQPEWGSLVGASAAAATPAFRKLRQADVIKTSYQKITVTNLRDLKILAELGQEPQATCPA